MAQCTDRAVIGGRVDEVHVCSLPSVHVFEKRGVNEPDPRAHRCTCGTWWYDVQQIDEHKRATAPG